MERVKTMGSMKKISTLMKSQIGRGGLSFKDMTEEEIMQLRVGMLNADTDEIGTKSNLSDRELRERTVMLLNASEGSLKDDIHCDKCNDKGIFFVISENRVVSTECDCMKKRQALRRLKKSGIANTVKRCTFEAYEDKEEWQKRLKSGALKFLKDVETLDNKWLYIGGGVGCGKTHLCTAVAGELLKKGYDLRYMLWIDDSAKLKATAMDYARYEELIEPIKSAEVLYIDDFFKLPPTQADLKLAYEIINYRSQNPEKITIISSEKYITELEEIDSATGSRIYEMSRGNAYNVKREKSRNYRMRDIELI